MTDRAPDSMNVRSRRARFSLAASASAVVIGGLVGALMIAPVACSSNDPIGAGGTCFETTDCANGLVCIPQNNGSRICSSI